MPGPKKNSNTQAKSGAGSLTTAPEPPAQTAAPPTSGYSKRANRGYNPKYEQDSYISLCGNKRKAPDAPIPAPQAKNISKN